MSEIEPWVARDMSGAYVELEHPADVFLEIRGPSLEELFENGLYAFYDHAADLRGVSSGQEMRLEISGASPAEALRGLLAEALYRFETDGFVGAAAEVEIHSATPQPPGTSPGVWSGAALGASSDAPRPPGAPPGAVQTSSAVRVAAKVFGERVERTRHTLLAEVKAVTYHRLEAWAEPGNGWKATVLLDV